MDRDFGKTSVCPTSESAATTSVSEHCNLSGNVQRSNRNDVRRGPQDALPPHRSARPCRSSKAADPHNKDDRGPERRPSWAADPIARTASRTSAQVPCRDVPTNRSPAPARNAPQFPGKLPNRVKYARPARSRAGGTALPPHTFWYWRSIASRHRHCQRDPREAPGQPELIARMYQLDAGDDRLVEQRSAREPETGSIESKVEKALDFRIRSDRVNRMLDFCERYMIQQVFRGL